MITSKHNTFGFWIAIAGIAISIFFIISYTTQYYFHFGIIKINIPNQRTYDANIIIFLLGLLFWGTFLYLRASKITIENSDPISKTISFKNLITGQTKTYSFEELDGYITTILWHKQFKQNKTICLIRNGRVVKKIDNFIYSNVDELEKSLADLKYLGFKNMGFINSWKVFFNQPII